MLCIWYCYVCVAGLLFCYVYYVSIVSAGFFGCQYGEMVK